MDTFDSLGLAPELRQAWGREAREQLAALCLRAGVLTGALRR